MFAPVSRPAAALLLAGLVLSHASEASAQSFLKNLAREAAQRAAAAAIAGQVQSPGAEGGAQAQVAAAADEGAPEAEPAPAASSGPAPWPSNVGARDVRYPTELKFSAELEAQKKAFVAFSKVRCGDCEGGYHFDAWAQHFVRLDGSYNAWEKKLGALAVGETISWQGSESKGAITAVSEEPVNGWPCKQLKWELTKPGARAERPGLICFANESWRIAF